jgi:hypothetical protein
MKSKNKKSPAAQPAPEIPATNEPREALLREIEYLWKQKQPPRENTPLSYPHIAQLIGTDHDALDDVPPNDRPRVAEEVIRFCLVHGFRLPRDVSEYLSAIRDALVAEKVREKELTRASRSKAGKTAAENKQEELKLRDDAMLKDYKDMIDGGETHRTALRLLRESGKYKSMDDHGVTDGTPLGPKQISRSIKKRLEQEHSEK